jgi:hypothetical protein
MPPLMMALRMNAPHKEIDGIDGDSLSPLPEVPNCTTILVRLGEAFPIEKQQILIQIQYSPACNDLK